MRSQILVPMLLAAIVFGAVGVGLGLFLGDMGAPLPSLESPRPQERDDGGADGGTPAITRVAERGERSRHGSGRARPAAAGIVADAVARLPAAEVLTGAGVITGTVKTVGSEPVEGVTVDLLPEREREPPDPRDPAEIPPSELIEWYARRVLWAHANRRSAVTDADGTFRFERCADSDHTLTARKDGYIIAPGDHNASRHAGDGDEVHFVATPTIRISARLVLPDGTDAETGSISFKRQNRSETREWSTTRPFADLTAGAWTAIAYAGAKQEFASEPVEVELEEGVEPPVLVFQLKGRPGIQGRVTFAQDEAPVNALVWVAPIDAGAEVSDALLKNGRQVWVQRGNGYAYQVLDLVPGAYAVGVARAHNASIVAIEKVQVGDGPAERDVAVPALEPSEYVTIRALDPDGATVRDLRVTVGYQGERRHSSSGATVIAMPDGTQRALHQEVPQEVTGGEYYVTVTSAEFGTARATYQKGASSEVTLRFERPAHLDVNIGGHTGTRYAGLVRVSLTRTEKHGKATRTVSSGRQDVGSARSVTFNALQPGTYTLSVTVGDRYAVTVAKTGVDVVSGANQVTLDVPPLYTVTVHSAQRAYARGQGDRRGVTVWGVQAEGKTVIDFLPAGEYEVRAGRERLKIAVPGTTDVRF